MPCYCDYMESNEAEKECDRIVKLLDSIIFDKAIDTKDYGSGYDDRVYNRSTKEVLDVLTSYLCSVAEHLNPEYIRSNPMLQEWWEKHQEMDSKHQKR